MSAKRDQLVKSALELFYRDGINATGIDKVLAESGVAKMTLYNHFKSKDELIAATLEVQDKKFNGFVEQEVSKHKDPIKKVLAIFDALDHWFRTKSYRGCYFVNATAELGSTEGPLRIACQSHKQHLTDQVHQLLKEGGIPNAAKMTRQLRLLMEGAIVQSQVLKDKEAARDAKIAATKLLEF